MHFFNIIHIIIELMAKFRCTHRDTRCCKSDLKNSWHGLELQWDFFFCMWMPSRPSQQFFYSIMHDLSLLANWSATILMGYKCNWIRVRNYSGIRTKKSLQKCPRYLKVGAILNIYFILGRSSYEFTNHDHINKLATFDKNGKHIVCFAITIVMMNHAQ